MPRPRAPADSPPPAVPRPRAGRGRARQRDDGRRHARGRPRARASRLAPLAILCLQAVMSLRLRNTAFEDEVRYLYAGRLELAHLLHGSALPGAYALYFPGAPALYPVLAAALNMAGGLALARALSLVEMLAATAMLYSITRTLFGRRVALCSAALFSVSAPVIFLGHLATFDATCVFLLAGATYIVVRRAGCRWPLYLLAAPLAALAVAVEYAGLLFVPTIAVLSAIMAWPARGCRALARVPVFGAVVAVLLYAGARLAGHSYAGDISGAAGDRVRDSALTIARDSGAWGGLVILLAVAGAVACTLRPRAEPDERIPPLGGHWPRVWLSGVLAGTAFLAPAYQMQLHTDVCLLKHIGLGLFFAAPMAGLGLVRLVGDYAGRLRMGIALWSTALVLAVSQWWNLYHAWPSSQPLATTLSPYLRPGARYLVEDPEVPAYYLRGLAGAKPGQFWSTFSIRYVNSHGQTLTGNAGFTAAIRAGYFRVVAYDGDVTPATDAVIAGALKSSDTYRLVAVLRLSDSSGPVTYDIWVHESPGAKYLQV